MNSSQFDPSTVMPICLPSSQDFNDTERQATAVGMGVSRSIDFKDFKDMIVKGCKEDPDKYNFTKDYENYQERPCDSPFRYTSQILFRKILQMTNSLGSTQGNHRQ